MPKVGKKHFAYTESGEMAAKKYAKKTGKKMTISKDKMRKEKMGMYK